MCGSSPLILEKPGLVTDVLPLAGRYNYPDHAHLEEQYLDLANC